MSSSKNTNTGQENSGDSNRQPAAMPLQRKTPASGRGKILILILIALVLIAGVAESLNFFLWKTPKDFKVKFLVTFRGDNNKCGSFNSWGVGPVGKDKVMVVDQAHNRILIFDRKGTFLKSWGKLGSGPLGFHAPTGMVSDSKGIGYVIDSWNSAIKGYDENGKPVFNLDLGDKSLYGPRGIGFDGKNFLVADTGNHRILLISPDGHNAVYWGTKGTEEGQFDEPGDVVSDGKGNYFVADTLNNRVQWLDQDGKVVKVFKLENNVAVLTLDRYGRLYVSGTTKEGASCVKVYSLQNGYLGELKDENGSVVSVDRGMAVSSDDVLMIADSDRINLYQLPSAAP